MVYEEMAKKVLSRILSPLLRSVSLERIPRCNEGIAVVSSTLMLRRYYLLETRQEEKRAWTLLSGPVMNRVPVEA